MAECRTCESFKVYKASAVPSPYIGGCYRGDKWRKWVSKSDYNGPVDCPYYRLKGRTAPEVVDRLVPVDFMDDIFEMQREIMEKVPDPTWDLEMMHKITCALGTIEETLEYINSIGRKPWRPQPLLPDRQLEELSDILHFFVEQVIRSGFTWSQVVERYRSKHQENLQRYEKGKAGDYSWDKRAEKREL